MCDTLQDALLDTVRQLLGQPTITADQLHLARLPVTAGGLGFRRRGTSLRTPPRHQQETPRADGGKLLGGSNATIPPIPWAAGAREATQALVRLRAVFGNSMRDQALESGVMAVLREHDIQTKPKNVSFSEDNGCPMPTGVRLGLPHTDPLSPLVFFTMTEVIHKAVRQTTSEVMPESVLSRPHVPGADNSVASR